MQELNSRFFEIIIGVVVFGEEKNPIGDVNSGPSAGRSTAHRGKPNTMNIRGLEIA